MAVYAIQAGDNGPVKLGYGNAEARLADLQIAHWQELRIIRLWEGGEAEERILHARFADLRLRGEWFSFSRAMLGDVGLTVIAVPDRRREPPTSQLSDDLALHRALLDEVEDFLVRHDMSPTLFGRKALNDGKFVGRLRSGLNMTAATIQKARAFMQDAAA